MTQPTLETFVTRLAKLPQTDQTISSLTTSLQTLRKDYAKIHAPPQTATLILRFTSDILGAEPPKAKWSLQPPWSEPSLETLCALLIDSLLSNYTSVISSLSSLHPPSPISTSFSNLMLTESERNTLPREHIHTLLPLPSAVIKAAFKTAPQTYLPAAHVVHTLLTLALDERAIALRRAVLVALCALCNALPERLVAAFLPGLVSPITKLLANCHTLPASVVVPALEVLLTIVCRALPREREKKRHVSSFSHALASRNSSVDEGDAHEELELDDDLGVVHDAWGEMDEALMKANSLLVKRDGKWVTEALKEVSLRVRIMLESGAAPTTHGSLRARLGAARFVRGVLGGGLDEEVKVVLRVTLVELAADEFDVVREVAGGIGVTEGGLRAVVNAVGGSQGEGVEEEVLRRMMKNRDDGFLQRVCVGYLRELCGMEKVEGVLCRVGVGGVCLVMMEALVRSWRGEEGVGLENCVLKTSVELGRKGLLTLIFAELVELCQGDGVEGFAKRAFATLILQAVVRGAMEAEGGERYVKYVYRSVREVLEVCTSFLLPNVTESLGQGIRVDDEMVGLKRCLLQGTALLFEELAAVYKTVLGKPLGSDLVLTVLMGLLKNVAYGEEGAREVAMETLRSVARVTRCANERRLLMRHLNFVVGRLCQSLEENWAAAVLAFLIGRDGDDVSAETISLLETTLRNLCNGLAAAGNTRALQTLAAVEGVLSTAVKQKAESEENDYEKEFRDVRQDDGFSEKDLARLRKKLLYYCTDDIEDYEKLTTVTDEDDDDTAWMGGEDIEPTLFQVVALDTLEGMRDLLVGRPWNVRAAALGCAALAVRLLEGNRGVLLPHAANLLPLIPDQFVVLNRKMTAADRLLDNIKKRKLRGKEDAEAMTDLVNDLNNKGAELPVVTNACLLIAALAKYAGDFIRDRFVRLIYPKMRPLLRLASAFPSLLSSRNITPSYGAMAASDACLQAIAGMAAVLPRALGPHAGSLVKYLNVYADDKFEPARHRNIGHLNRAMLRHEQERWEKRARWARIIVGKLKKVNPCEVFVVLAALGEGDDVIRAQSTQLYDLRIRKG